MAQQNRAAAKTWTPSQAAGAAASGYNPTTGLTTPGGPNTRAAPAAPASGGATGNYGYPAVASAAPAPAGGQAASATPAAPPAQPQGQTPSSVLNKAPDAAAPSAVSRPNALDTAAWTPQENRLASWTGGYAGARGTFMLPTTASGSPSSWYTAPNDDVANLVSNNAHGLGAEAWRSANPTDQTSPAFYQGDYSSPATASSKAFDQYMTWVNGGGDPNVLNSPSQAVRDQYSTWAKNGGSVPGNPITQAIMTTTPAPYASSLPSGPSQLFKG